MPAVLWQPILLCSFKSLAICLHIPTYTLEEHSSNSNSCVRGDTGSQWYRSAVVGGFSVRERLPGRPCSIGLSSPFWLPLFHHFGCGTASRYCRSTTCCWYPLLENHAATAHRLYMAKEPGHIWYYSKVWPVFQGQR